MHTLCIRPDVKATLSYYGNYVQTKCNHSDSRATLSGHGLNMEMRGACYEKPVAQKTFQKPPREF
jgi:methyl coenzyme M reductase alpha subunit